MHNTPESLNPQPETRCLDLLAGPRGAAPRAQVPFSLSLFLEVYMHVYTHTCICVCIYTYMCVYIYIYILIGAEPLFQGLTASQAYAAGVWTCSLVQEALRRAHRC